MKHNVPIIAAVVTVSDTRKPENDVSGERLAELLNDAGADVAERIIVSDDRAEIRAVLEALIARAEINLVLTTGGTGFAPRDNTPEATREVIDREANGIAEAMRRETAGKTPMAMMSRGVSGIAGSTLIINLPGSPKAVEECFEIIRPILGHAINLICGETAH